MFFGMAPANSCSRSLQEGGEEEERRGKRGEYSFQRHWNQIVEGVTSITTLSRGSSSP